MPRYRFTYVLETPLSANEDTTFTSSGFPVTLLFSDRIDSLNIHLQAVAEGRNWQAANEIVMDEVISGVLDALALHRKAPSMLQELLHVVKAEEGARRRKAVVIEHRVQQTAVDIDQVARDEVQDFLNRAPRVNRATVRWLRYCYRPINVLERFVYSWLAFENQLGTVKIQPRCGTCNSDLPARPSVNREAAFQLLSQFRPVLTRQEFEEMFRGWWNDLRSPIFHGGRVAKTATRTQMRIAMDFYRIAAETSAQRQAGFRAAYPGLLPNDGLLQHAVYQFIEFAAPDEAAEFVDPPPVVEVVERQQLPAGVDLLDYQRDAAGW